MPSSTATTHHTAKSYDRDSEREAPKGKGKDKGKGKHKHKGKDKHKGKHKGKDKDKSKDKDEADVEYDPEWREGDFELVSSDGVHFRVPSFYLYAASGVLRDALGVADASSRKIEFTDLKIESGNVIRKFLRMAAGKPLKLNRKLEVETHLAVFLRKWDCEGLLRGLLMHTRDALRNSKEPDTAPIEPLSAFLLAAKVEDVDTCVISLENGLDQIWDEPDSDRCEDIEPRPDESVFDPTAWGVETWKLGLSYKYVWALSRAFGDVGATPELATRFKKLLEIYSKP